MATKQDILEQIVEEYLIHEGYFVQHNIKYQPCKDPKDYDRKKDSNHSDIDVIGLHPSECGERKVMVVSCKSWENGVNPQAYIDGINYRYVIGGRDAWKYFRELTVDKWLEAFIKKVLTLWAMVEKIYMI